MKLFISHDFSNCFSYNSNSSRLLDGKNDFHLWSVTLMGGLTQESGMTEKPVFEPKPPVCTEHQCECGNAAMRRVHFLLKVVS